MCIRKLLKKKHQLTHISRKTYNYGYCSVGHKSEHVGPVSQPLQAHVNPVGC